MDTALKLFFRIWKIFVLFITSFIPIKEKRRSLRKSMLKLKFYCKRYAFEDNTKFPVYLSALVCSKNEAPYLKEWIEYHLLLGIERFYFFDNESKDNTYEILKPYIDKGIVVYHTFSFKGDIWPKPQIEVYTKAVRKYKKETRWMAVFDIDEFIVPIKHDTISEFLKSYEAFSQITIHYKFFGSCGHKTKPNGLVIENYLYSRKSSENTVDSVVNDNTGKSIINPRAACGKIYEHYSSVIGMPVDERKMPYLEDPSVIGATTDIIEVNHYWSKSEEECLSRELRNTNKLSNFNNSESEYNDDILRFLPKLKERLDNS
ncbi:MAG: glycosyltransferase family 92 protein [Elusimicrobiota bacterium]|jgi:hypothetical protein|nr:glycosyltransferase family 92 protein [Elusimicrobiota bacterium]